MRRASPTTTSPRSRTGCAAPTGAPISPTSSSRRASRGARLFRIAAYEDLRHYLKHKRSYAPEALTATEKRILARKSWVTRIWMATGKKVYIAITRGLFRFTDREGGGPRLVNDAPVIAAQLKSQAQVRDVVVLAFPDRRAGTGLYAFVEGEPGADESAIADFVDAEPADAPRRRSACSSSRRCRAAPTARCAPRSSSSSR